MTSHSSEHAPPKAAYDDLSIRSIALVGGVGSVLVFVAVVAVQVVYFRYEQAEYRRKVLDVPTTKVNAVLDAQRAKLADAGTGANVENAERSIPIDKAMQLVLSEYQSKRSDDGEQAQAAPDESAASDVQVASDDDTTAVDPKASNDAAVERK